MNLKKIVTILFIFENFNAAWSKGAIAGAVVGGAALAGGAAFLAFKANQKKKEEEAKKRIQLTKDISDKKIERSQLRSDRSLAKADLFADLSSLQTTMDILNTSTKDKIDDLSSLLNNSSHRRVILV